MIPRNLRMQSLQAELSSLNSLLQGAKEYGDFVGEFQLEKRKEKLEAELGALAEQHCKKASVALLFGGKPVLGSRGISADFAGHILGSFQDLIARMYAAAELGSLGERGPIPMRQAAGLMVTSLAKGSFGFVLDELSDQEELDKTSLGIMIEKVVKTIEDVSSTNELDFEEAVEELDSRLLISLKDFFVALDSAEATIRVVDDSADISLDQIDVQRARLRTEATKIEEDEKEIIGLLTGFLPEHKKFEMQVGAEKLYGAVSQEAAKQYAMFISEGQVPERQKWKIKVKQRTVIPLNRPPRDVFRLLEFIKLESE